MTPTMDFTTLSISQIRELLTSRQATAVEIAQAHLARIEEKDKDVRAYLSLCPERAMAQVTYPGSENPSFRADEPHLNFSQDQALANAPEQGAGCFKVPRVIEREE